MRLDLTLNQVTPFRMNTIAGQLFVANTATLEAIAYRFSIFVNDVGSPPKLDEAIVTTLVTKSG